jgi:hypothetical protein
VLLHEALQSLHVEAVVHVGVPFQSGRKKVLVAEASLCSELLVFHVVVGQSGQLAALPGEVAHVERLMDGPEEDQAV